MQKSVRQLMLRRASTAAVLGTSIVALAACGGSSNQKDITQAVANFNNLLSSHGIGVTLSCPSTVATDAQFDCTYTNKTTGKKATVRLHLTGSNHDKIDVVNATDARAALVRAAGSG